MSDRFTCDNCLRDRIKKGALSTLSSGKIHQGLELIFKSHQITLNEDTPNPLKFCNNCAKSFEKMFKSYSEFLQASTPGSYVQCLWKSVAEHVNGGERFKLYDHTLFSPRVLAPPPPSKDVEDVNGHPPPIVEFLEDLIPMTSGGVDIIKTKQPSTSTHSSMTMTPRKRSRKSTQNQFPRSLEEGEPSKVKVHAPDLEETHKNTQRVVCSTLPLQLDDGRVLELEEEVKDTSSEVLAQPFLRGRKDNLKSQLLGKRTNPKEEDHPKVEGIRNIFECLTCHEMFPTFPLRRTHMLNHKTEDEDDDEGGQPTPESRFVLSEDEESLLLTSEYKCDDEGCEGELTFVSFKDWVLHQEWTHKVDTGYVDAESVDNLIPIHGHVRPCPQCGKKYETQVQVLSHVKQVHVPYPKEYPCKHCTRTFSSTNSRDSHARKEHPLPVTRNFLCVHCGAHFTHKGGLELHESLHFEELVDKKKKEFECEECGKKFQSSTALKNHFQSIHGPGTFTCDKCHVSFRSIKNLRTHNYRQHVKKFIRDQVCELCGKGFAFKDKLKDHLMGVHKMEKEEARSVAKLTRNPIFRITPNGERIFKEKPRKPTSCEICGKKYVRREQLTRHMMTEHGKGEEEAKQSTGFETNKSLVEKRKRKGTRSSARIKQNQKTN